MARRVERLETGTVSAAWARWTQDAGHLGQGAGIVAGSRDRPHPVRNSAPGGGTRDGSRECIPRVLRFRRAVLQKRCTRNALHPECVATESTAHGTRCTRVAAQKLLPEVEARAAPSAVRLLRDGARRGAQSQLEPRCTQEHRYNLNHAVLGTPAKIVAGSRIAPNNKRNHA